MDSYFPLIYLAALTTILGVIGWFVLREVVRNRQQESVLRRLQARLVKGKGSPEEHYQLGSVYLDKRLYDQAIAQLKKALEVAEGNIPQVCNALGFAYFSQNQYDLAIRYYKDALEVDPSYVTAWNNLGHAYEKKNLASAGLEAYQRSLDLDPKNAVAQRRFTSLRKRIATAEAKS
jgi:tetratricopeptide (TPR) repeat protein